jgi:hypothetical protein
MHQKDTEPGARSRVRPGHFALYGRLGGLTASARGTNTTEAARRAFLARFERQVDPDGTLPPAERSRRAEAAKRAHMTRLSMLARNSRRTGPEAA